MPHPVKLVSVATVVPPYLLKQDDIAAAAHRSFAARYSDYERVARVFKSSGNANAMQCARLNGVSRILRNDPTLGD